MTETLSPGRQRQLPAEIAGTQRAVTLVRPLASKFTAWNHRAAKASALARSHLATPKEKAVHELELAMLYSEVEVASQTFEQAVAGHPSHGRIDDVRAAFARLLEQLAPWRVVGS